MDHAPPVGDDSRGHAERTGRSRLDRVVLRNGVPRYRVAPRGQASFGAGSIGIVDGSSAPAAVASGGTNHRTRSSARATPATAWPSIGCDHMWVPIPTWLSYTMSSGPLTSPARPNIACDS